MVSSAVLAVGDEGATQSAAAGGVQGAEEEDVVEGKVAEAGGEEWISGGRREDGAAEEVDLGGIGYHCFLGRTCC